MWEKTVEFFRWNRLYNYAGLLGGAMLSALGGWDLPLRGLVGAMALDYASGVIVAIRERTLSSQVGFQGIARKLMIFLIVIISGSLDALLGEGAVCRTAAIAFYFTNEAVSLLENAKRIGLPVPEAIVQRLAQVKGTEKKDEEE